MLSGITLGQYIPGHSLLHLLDPRTKVIGVLASAVSIIAFTNWQGFVLVTLLTLTALLVSKLPLGIILGSLKSLWLLLVITFLLQTFLTPGTLLVELGPLSISREGLFAAGEIVLRLALLILIAFLPTLTTPPIKLTAGLEGILSPLQRLGVPAHELALMMTLALRFIPTLLQEAEVVISAQRSRGAGFTTGSPARWAKSLLPLFVPLFAGALRRADDLAVAMESRCYRGGANRTRMSTLKFSALDYVVIGVTLAVLAGVVALRLI
ncbi:MAG: energy-coupling factor transporter transmembrane component T [Desulfotomaculaceae bacterium]|nr:energy-coupling factor transporter transmembrane component T [Desulfotomaculaceae bacterium]MDD4767144.1 energy-coupling factor transporter transmembrane component T [Desulfotomaculaceae bacterium]